MDWSARQSPAPDRKKKHSASSSTNPPFMPGMPFMPPFPGVSMVNNVHVLINRKAQMLMKIMSCAIQEDDENGNDININLK